MVKTSGFSTSGPAKEKSINKREKVISGLLTALTCYEQFPVDKFCLIINQLFKKYSADRFLRKSLTGRGEIEAKNISTFVDQKTFQQPCKIRKFWHLLLIMQAIN